MLTMSISGRLLAMMSVRTMASAPRLLAYTTRPYCWTMPARNSLTWAAFASSSRVSICAMGGHSTGDNRVTERTIASDELRHGYVLGRGLDIPPGYNPVVGI